MNGLDKVLDFTNSLACTPNTGCEKTFKALKYALGEFFYLCMGVRWFIEIRVSSNPGSSTKLLIADHHRGKLRVPSLLFKIILLSVSIANTNTATINQPLMSLLS